MDTPSLIDVWDVLNIPKKNGIPQILHPGSQHLFQTCLFPFLGSRGWVLNCFLWDSPSDTTWEYRDHLGSPDPDFRWKLGILFTTAPVGRDNMSSVGKKCEPDREKRRNQLPMDPLECFLPVVIPCLFRQHLPLDTLPITIIVIGIVINLFLDYSTWKTNPATKWDELKVGMPSRRS